MSPKLQGSTSVYRHRVQGLRDAGSGCSDCHQAERQYGHPVNFRPSRTLDTAYPLDDDGRFVCTTCHGQRDQMSGSDRTDPGCVGCHDDPFFAVMPDGGLSTGKLAHPLSADMLTADALDPVSIGCIGCHTDKSDRQPARIAHRNPVAGHGRDHPVGSLYAEHVAYGGYVSPLGLPDEIRLPGGRLGCVSCHRSYSAHHGAVVELASGRPLCSACHDL